MTFELTHNKVFVQVQGHIIIAQEMGRSDNYTVVKLLYTWEMIDNI